MTMIKQIHTIGFEMSRFKEFTCWYSFAFHRLAPVADTYLILPGQLFSICFVKFAGSHFESVKECHDWKNGTEVKSQCEITGQLLHNGENYRAKGT